MKTITRCAHGGMTTAALAGVAVVAVLFAQTTASAFVYAGTLLLQ